MAAQLAFAPSQIMPEVTAMALTTVWAMVLMPPPYLIRLHAVVVQPCVGVNRLTQDVTVVAMNFYSVMP